MILKRGVVVRDPKNGAVHVLEQERPDHGWNCICLHHPRSVYHQQNVLVFTSDLKNMEEISFRHGDGFTIEKE